MRRLFAAIALIAFVVIAPGGSAAADENHKLQAKPFVFVGDAGDCGPLAGSRIVTSAWLGGMGLPDNGGDTALNGTPLTRNDPHLGLLLSKNGPTADCSASGARISGVKGMAAGPAFVLGFDYRNGGHCGAGAPRFNVVTRDAAGTETFHFIGGCANGVQTPAPQDPAQWTRARFALAMFPPIVANSEIVSISIIFDEGTDAISAQDPMGVGLAVVDNIFINGTYIRQGSGIQPPPGRNDESDDD
jgi:hypothetical protein